MRPPRHRFTAARQRLAAWLAVPSPGIPLSAVRRFLPADATIVEAGASTGADALELAQLWPNGTVHAFEPEPATYHRLVQTVGGLSNVCTWNLALGAEDGTATLHVSSGPYGTAASSLLAPREHLSELPRVRFETDLVVPQQTLSTWAQEHGIPRCDLLALDLQGMELGVLEASRPLLSEVSVVIAEVFMNEKYAGCATVAEMQAFLTGEGFVVLETNMYWGTCGDMLAVNHVALETTMS